MWLYIYIRLYKEAVNSTIAMQAHAYLLSWKIFKYNIYMHIHYIYTHA